MSYLFLISLIIFILNTSFVLSQEPISLRKELPEERLTVPGIIKYYGYTCEIHKVITEDGYILEMHRIPFGRNFNETEQKKPRKVVFAQHGLLSSSFDWVSNLPHQSLAFLLADAGFDVWMGNMRGNLYSKDHERLSRISDAYWDFTWDKMSSIDLPAMINKALEVSGQSKLYYVGHSQGTLIMFAQLSNNNREFVDKISRFYALAPVATIKYIKGLIDISGKLFGIQMEILNRHFGSNEFLPSNFITQQIARTLCGANWQKPSCKNIMFLIGGTDSKQMNQTRVTVYTTHAPAGTSTRNIAHWAQMHHSGLMQKFNYGSRRANQKHYGQNTPPIYNLTNIADIPIYLYYSEADWLATKKDVEETILQQIPQENIKLANELPNFNHLDFIWGQDAAEEIYGKIIKEISEED
uniref:Lipase n=1 Tax=Meloidogyne enterolobii TaxID=390850 RepID=A0A6V7W0B2_MELEN|nr:unnamed protein product [Meloidogyne enterolobii]